MTHHDEQEPFAVWAPKSARERVRVSLGAWEGRPMLDVRAFALTPDGPVHTRKGITLSLDHAPALSQAILEALEEARSRGLLHSENEDHAPPVSDGG
jgi:hypothetical protein